MGKRCLSQRLTHDMNFQLSDSKTVNNQVRPDLLTSLVYGFALYRFLHCIVATRLAFPFAPILLFKCDLKSAYWRIQACPNLAFQSVTTTTAEIDEGQSPVDPIALA